MYYEEYQANFHNIKLSYENLHKSLIIMIRVFAFFGVFSCDLVCERWAHGILYVFSRSELL
jgi:hypothetical protein